MLQISCGPHLIAIDMIEIQEEVLILAPLDTVDNLLVEPASCEYIWGVYQALADHHWPSPGSRIEITHSLAGKVFTSVLTVLERNIERGRITTAYDMPDGSLSTSLREGDLGTHISLKMQICLPPVLDWFPMNRMMEKACRDKTKDVLSRAKLMAESVFQQAESGGAPA